MLCTQHCSGNHATTKFFWKGWKVRCIKYSSWKRTADGRLFFKYCFILFQQNPEIFLVSWKRESRTEFLMLQTFPSRKGTGSQEQALDSHYDLVLKKFINEPAAGLCWENWVDFVLQQLAGDVNSQRSVSLQCSSNNAEFCTGWLQFPSVVDSVPYQTQILFQLPPAEVYVSDISLWYTRKVFFIVVIYSRWQFAWFWFHSDCTTLLFIAESFLFFHSSHHAIIFIPCFSS